MELDIKSNRKLNEGFSRDEQALCINKSNSSEDDELSNDCLDDLKNYLESSDYEKAITAAESILKSSPFNVEATLLGGHAARKFGNFEQAYYFLKAGLQIDSKNKRIAEEFRQLHAAIVKASGDDSFEEKDYNALKFCSQEYYPGDDELFCHERQILECKHRISPTLQSYNTVDAQRAKAASREAIIAHGLLSSDNVNDALYHSTCAVDLDPTNPSIRQLRAELLTTKGDSIGALKDLYMIPKQKRAQTVWKMGGKILQELDLLVTAEFWLRKATVFSGGNDEEAAKLFQQCRIKRLYDPLVQNYSVRVAFTEYGKTVFATEDIAAGETVFEDIAVVHAQLLNSISIPLCDNCGVSLMCPKDYFGSKMMDFDDALKNLIRTHWPEPMRIVCNSCNNEKYCSDDCRIEAWETYHQVICPSHNPPAQQIYDICENYGVGYDEKGQKVDIWTGHFSPLTLVKTWAMIVCEAKRLMKEKGMTQPQLEHWARAKIPFRKFIAFGSPKAHSNMPLFFKLVQDVFQNCPDGICYPIDEKEFDARFIQSKCNLQTFSNKYTPYHGFMTSLSKSDDINAIRMIKHLHEKAPDAFLAGMFPLHACMNHACSNNVDVSDTVINGRPGVTVTAHRDIKKGEEVCTTYVDTTMPRKLRRAWLYKSFNFWCQCLRCQFEGEDSETCTHCKTKANTEKGFRACSSCHRAWYCSTECQKKSWSKGHKIVCKLPHSDIRSSEDFKKKLFNNEFV